MKEFKIPPLPDMNSPEYKAIIAASKLAKYAEVGKFNMDNWPAQLWNHTFGPNILVPLDPQVIVDVMDQKYSENTLKFVSELQEIMAGKEWFIKLGSRSPKDYMDVPITSSAEKVVDILACSLRTVDDLCDHNNCGVPSFLVLRKPVKIPKRNEWRCFVRDNKLIGISQYFYNETFDYNRHELVSISENIKKFFEGKIQPCLKDYQNYVFDVFFPQDSYSPILIEINPWGLSDPCTFKDYKSFDIISPEIRTTNLFEVVLI